MRVCGRIRVRKLRNGLRTFPRSSIRNDDFFQFREKVFGFFFGKKPPRNPFNFEIHLNDHCNLNCKSCFHFVPLAKPDSYYPLDEFERDIKRLCSLFDGKWLGSPPRHGGPRGLYRLHGGRMLACLVYVLPLAKRKMGGKALIKKEESNQIQAS